MPSIIWMRRSPAYRARTYRCPMLPISRNSPCPRWPKSSQLPKPSVIAERSGAQPMPINILMPALSPTMEKGNLAKWLKKEGDKIKSGDVLAEIETDKATMEVEAVDEGVLAKILVPEGTADVPVNNVIAVIAGEGEDAKAISGPTKSSAPAQAAPKPAAAPASANVVAMPAVAAVSSQGAPRLFATPLARRLAKDGGIDLARIAGSGPNGRIVERDVKAALASGEAPMQATVTPLILPASVGDVRSFFAP